MSERTVQRQVRNLEDAGLLSLLRPPGRKLIWILFPQETDPRTADGGSPVEISTPPPSELRGRGVTAAGDPRRADTPVPPLESRERRERKAVGDDDLRKKAAGQEEDADLLAGLVRQFGDGYATLLGKAPDHPEVLALEELALAATDVDGWRAVNSLLAFAIANLADNRKEADA